MELQLQGPTVSGTNSVCVAKEAFCVSSEVRGAAASSSCRRSMGHCLCCGRHVTCLGEAYSQRARLHKAQQQPVAAKQAGRLPLCCCRSVLALCGPAVQLRCCGVCVHSRQSASLGCCGVALLLSLPASDSVYAIAGIACIIGACGSTLLLSSTKRVSSATCSCLVCSNFGPCSKLHTCQAVRYAESLVCVP